MSENIDLNLNLDPSGYVQGAAQAGSATSALSRQFQGTERQAGAVQKALSVITPGKVFTAASVASAAAWQQQLSGMAATASVTQQNMAKLQQGMAGLARSMPVGNRGAAEITSTLQSMGYSGKEQIKTIGELGKAYSQLGQSTGQNAAIIGRQMTTLSRAFGASDNDTKRFTKMSDSLTTVTAKIGGSSSDIAQFSKSIAPMARSAGIGQTAVMGISAAFSKMGEDGYGAANAMNKMLTDLNRSVRDGSSEMGTYAQIVGKTKDEFAALFKADPTKALGLLTKSLGSGPGAERNLERIGLDGVRTSRVFQALGQQGGIEKAANTAIEGYGDGSTKKAAAASDGLFDEFTKLRAATEQVTEALGRPFLGALTKVVEVTGAPVRGAARVLQSPGAQKAIEWGAPLAAMAIAARVLGAFGNSSSMVRQLLLNNQMTQGFKNARQAELTGASTVPGRPYNAIGRFGYNAGSGFADSRSEYRESRIAATRANLIDRGVPIMQADQQARQPGASAWQRARGAPRAAMNAAAQGRLLWNAMNTENSRQLRTQDATMRSGSVLKNAGLEPLAAQLKKIQATGLPAAQRLTQMQAAIASFATTTNAETKAVGAATKIIRNELATTGVGLRAFAAQVRATLAMVTGGPGAAGAATRGRLGGFAAGAGAAGVGALKGIGAMMSPAMIALMGGMASFSYLKGETTKNKEQNKDWANASTSGTMDAYRNAMGRATEATQTFAEQVLTANKAMMSTAVYDEQGRTLTSSDEQVAEDTRGKKVKNYTGSAREIAARINAASGGTMDAQDLKAVSVDLRRQFSKQTTDQVMAMVGGSKGMNADGTAADARDYSGVFGAIGSDQSGTSIKKRFMRNILGQEGDTGGGANDVIGSITSRPGKIVTGLASGFGAWNTGGEVGGRFNSYSISKEQQQGVEAVREGIGTRYRSNRDNYSEDWAKQDQAQDINKAYAEAMKTGNKDLIAATSKALSIQLGGADNAANVTGDEAKNKGGFIQAYMAENKWAKENLKGIELDPNKKGADKTAVDSALTKATGSIDIFGKVLSNRAGDIDTEANKAAKAFLELPGNTQLLRKSLDATSMEALKAGRSNSQLADAALQTAKALNNTGDAAALARAQFERAFSMNEFNAGYQGDRATSANRVSMGQSLMRNADGTEQGGRDAAQGREILQGEAESTRQRMVARLQAQFEFQKQSKRAQDDFNLQRQHSQEDYDLGLARAEEDFGIQRVRAVRDYNIQIAQSMEDFATQRMRSQRDFNKSMTRQNEDAAKSMYDPYKRIQTQAVSDMGTLMVNLGEQNEQMEAQKANLDTLRKAGLSNNAIDQLGLGKTENAQQAQRLVDDVASGMSTQGLNTLIATRMKDAGVLLDDSSNKDRARAKEDFAQGMRDNNADFQKGIKRNREAFARGLADQNADYNRSLVRQLADFQKALDRQDTAFNLQLTRQKEDIADSTKSIFAEFGTLAAATQDALAGKAVDFRDLMKKTLEGTIQDAAAMVAKYPAFFQGVMTEAGVAANRTYTGSQAERGAGAAGEGMGHAAQAAVIKDAFSGVSVTSALRPGAVTASGNTSYHASGRAIDIGPPSMTVFNWLRTHYPNSKELIYSPAGKNQIKDGKNYFYGPEVAKGHYDHIHWAMAKGGIAKRAPGGVQATLAEAGSNEAVIPLDNRGVAVLAQAMTQYITGPDAQRMLTGSKGDRVTYTGNTFIEDHSTQVTGPITVQADDPNAMMRALQAKARAANLTATPTRKGR